MKRWLGTVAAALAVAVWPAAAFCHDVDGKFGIGFEETLTGIATRQLVPATDKALDLQAVNTPDVRAAGVAVRGYLGNWGFEGVLGANLQFTSAKDDHSAAPPTQFAAFLSAGAFYNVVRAPQVNLAIGLRVLGAMARTNVSEQAGPLRWGAALELPVRIEYFFNQQFAIAGAVGPNVIINGDRTNPLSGTSKSTDLALTRGDFGGGVGFTYYLR